MNALRTPCRAISAIGLFRIELVEACAPPPARRDAAKASSASSSPPAQAQSAGVQNRSPGCGKKSCGISMPGRWPSSTRWRMQRAFRLARWCPTCRSSSPDRRACVGSGVKSDEAFRDRRVEIERAVGRAVDRDHAVQAGNVFPDLGELRQTLRIGDQRLRAGILQPVGDRIRAEQQRESAARPRRACRSRHGRRRLPASAAAGSRRDRRVSTPCARSTLASRFEVSFSQPKVMSS